jgi:4-amino-4-deoxy-L-arabinose transferase-like glycosyltransferase
MRAQDVLLVARQWAWFMWPAWPLALWTLWRWRDYLANRHLAVPLVVVATALLANLAMAGSDRALMLGLPGLAMLAAFALPTLKRGASAAIDWFSMFFFTGGAIAIWVIYSAMQTGAPAKPAANIARLAPGFEPRFSPLALGLAALGTLAWAWLLRWRTGRHREALWKSLVLPAGGVALCWLLTMTLLLPPLDYALSNRPLAERIAAVVPADAPCIAAPGASPVTVATLEYLGGYTVDARPGAGDNGGACPYLLNVTRARQVSAPAGWEPVADLRRPTERDERTLIYRRAP